MDVLYIRSYYNLYLYNFIWMENMREQEQQQEGTATVTCHDCGWYDDESHSYKDAERMAVSHHTQTGCENVYVKEEKGSATIVYGYSKWDMYR